MPVSELPEDESPELIQCGNDSWFEVVGFSKSRDAYLILPIQVDGAADELEEQIEAGTLKSEG